MALALDKVPPELSREEALKELLADLLDDGTEDEIRLWNAPESGNLINSVRLCSVG
jgi:hypothetical protein